MASYALLRLLAKLLTSLLPLLGFLERRVYKGPPEDLGFQGHPGEGLLMAASRFFRSLGLWRGAPGKKLLPLYRGFCPQGPLGP